ncbi:MULTISPECIES: hypothetical protein [Halorussus]|uniref:hypothetical protein n=1 Tax=Halorussus TaxID=1070314 RepID=UPI0020A1B46E|nr:hypothetical protein [Halorussus vallis]USZ75341.1 hypothetical protein NGM07_18145 [Halorussus vallis]
MRVENFLLFFAGVLLLVGALAVGIGALEYEVVSEGTVTTVPQQRGFGSEPVPVVRYEELSAHDRRVVDRAIAGDRVVIRDAADLPGLRPRKGRLGVRRDGRLYLLNRHLFFNWRTPFAAGAASLALVGLGAVAESIRREHFPDRRFLIPRR